MVAWQGSSRLESAASDSGVHPDTPRHATQPRGWRADGSGFDSSSAEEEVVESNFSVASPALTVTFSPPSTVTDSLGLLSSVVLGASATVGP